MWGNLRVRQAATLYAASFAGIPLSIVTSIVFTRFLGPQGYGDFSFLDSLFDFARIIFPAGFFYAANRALVLNNDHNKAREYYGAALVILLLLFAAMAASMLIYGLLDPNLEAKGLRTFFLLLLPFGWIFLLTPYFDNLLHADNRIHDLAATRFLPKLVTFSAAIIIYFLMNNYAGNRLAIIWPVYLLAFLLVYLLVFWRIRISFRNLRQRMSTIFQHHQSYGIHLYAGTLFSAGAVSLTGVLISYFSDDNTGVGFFALAVAISRPLALIPGVIAVTWFKDFSKQTRISNRLLIIMLLLSILAFAVLLMLAGPFVRFFYIDDFTPVIPLIYLCSVGMLFYGLGSFFNRFLEAHGFGKLVRNTHILMGVALLALNLWLIPKYGPAGAAVAMVVASVIYLAGMWSGYIRGRK